MGGVDCMAGGSRRLHHGHPGLGFSTRWQLHTRYAASQRGSLTHYCCALTELFGCILYSTRWGSCFSTVPHRHRKDTVAGTGAGVWYQRVAGADCLYRSGRQAGRWGSKAFAGADEKKVQRGFELILTMLPDIAEVAINTFINRAAGISTVFQKIAQKAKENLKTGE